MGGDGMNKVFYHQTQNGAAHIYLRETQTRAGQACLLIAELIPGTGASRRLANKELLSRRDYPELWPIFIGDEPDMEVVEEIIEAYLDRNADRRVALRQEWLAELRNSWVKNWATEQTVIPD
jgi:hypothetical protein